MADKKYKASAKCDKNTRERRLRKWTGQTRPLRGGGEKYREQAESGEIGQLCISREIGRATEEMTTQGPNLHVPRLAREEESLPPFRQECWPFPPMASECPAVITKPFTARGVSQTSLICSQAGHPKIAITTFSKVSIDVINQSRLGSR